MSRRWILVTGGAGFIGSNIVAELCARDDYDIAVCDRLRSAESGKWRNIAKQPIADFVAPEAMFAWLDERQGEVEAIIHMGAISSTTEPDADLIIHNNFSLSKALWAWCAKHETRLIYASSAATYGDGALGFDDADDEASLKALRPLNAYGWSKALFDIHARRQADRGFAPPQWAGLKFFNVYGPNEYHKGSMRSVVHQVWPAASKGETVSLFRSHRPDYADGGQLRDFVYVRDCASVAVWLLTAPNVSGVFNLGTGQARSFKDLATAVFKVAGQEPRLSYIDTPAVIRDKYQYFTQARMDRLVAAGYGKPFTSLEDGVSDYVLGYLATEEAYR
ncbi:ADP-glyceromanno-heptose 6-epimerase [Caulobacter segnis]|uniref:ADP-glyceromanno-heptose 6-epimerase n=1 Tax=Caulobacter segnis TaxID=88688 RepID=UPI00285A673D|nr:ADP-glyceromanno-heptose 6-epimerase [Caulobacter segnis]MDR6624948.1 ADP-L-glycero-D-manno-heptose 6-epimerase [Caulobacter segnis]